MRMRKRQNLAPRMEACRSVWLEDAAYLRGNWRSLMPQARELRLEIGCGKGKFTVETAALEPDVLFVAVERVQEALVLAMEKALSMGLKNVYFLSIDAAKLEEYFAPGEVDLIYLNFCDPWPRKKNAKRRLTFHTFLKSYQRVLRLNGEIHFKTDNAPLFEWSLGEFEACGLEIRNPDSQSARERPRRHHDGLRGKNSTRSARPSTAASSLTMASCPIRSPQKKDEQTGIL